MIALIMLSVNYLNRLRVKFIGMGNTSAAGFVRVLKILAVCFSLLLAYASILTQGRRASATRNPSQTQFWLPCQEFSYARSQTLCKSVADIRRCCLLAGWLGWF